MGQRFSTTENIVNEDRMHYGTFFIIAFYLPWFSMNIRLVIDRFPGPPNYLQLIKLFI